MSNKKKNIVNPGRYKTAGREAPGQGVDHEVLRQNFEEVKVEEKKREPEGRRKAQPRKLDGPPR